MAFIFFLFFTSPILSPFINGYTIYLNWFIPLIDLSFIYYLTKKRFNLNLIIVFFAFTLILILLQDTMIAVKIALLIMMILYLLYLKEKNHFKMLYTLAFINIVIAMIQFIFTYINPEISRIIGPSNISEVIWGQFATPSFTNFFSIFILPRVSGWSREAGFFASFVIVTYVMFLFDKEKQYSKSRTLIYHLTFIIGIIISMSKVSFIALLAVLVIKYRKQLNQIPLLLGTFLFLAFMVVITNTPLFQNLFKNSESFTHRLSGYSVLPKITMPELFFGVPTVRDLGVFSDYSYIQALYYADFPQFAGLPNTIIHQGLIVFIMCLALISILKFTFSDFLLITVICATTDYFTSTSFVVLGFFLILYAKRANEKEVYLKLKIEENNKRLTFNTSRAKLIPFSRPKGR